MSDDEGFVFKRRNSALSDDEGSGSDAGGDISPTSSPVLKFRNYTPRDEDLVKGVLEEEEVPTLDDEYEMATEEIKEEREKQEADVDIAPKAPNWDLKRDVEGKLALLQRQTQQAIVEILKEKIAREEEEEDEEGESSEDEEED